MYKVTVTCEMMVTSFAQIRHNATLLLVIVFAGGFHRLTTFFIKR